MKAPSSASRRGATVARCAPPPEGGIERPVARVWSTIYDVERFARYLPMVNHARRRGDSVAFDLKFRVGFFSAGFEFTTHVTYEEEKWLSLAWTAGEPRDIKLRFALTPVPEEAQSACMVETEAEFDVQSLGWLVKYFLKHHPEIQHGIFPGITLVLLDSNPPRDVRVTAPRVLDALLRAAAALVVLSMFATALHDVSQAWDSGYYHLPFAARLAGILPPSVFVFHPANAARFDGFPLLGERLQGLLWRVTGRPECANLVALASVPLLAWFLRRRFAVDLHLTVLALFAVPLVHTHATSAYVDLPANAALAVVVLLAIDAFARPAPATPGRERTLLLAGTCAAIAANMKALLHPLVALGVVLLVARVLPWIVSDLRASQTLSSRAPHALGDRRRPADPLCDPLANLVTHGNPYYPLRMSVLGHALPGTEATYSSSPPWLDRGPAPRALRMLAPRARDPAR